MQLLSVMSDTADGNESTARASDFTFSSVPVSFCSQTAGSTVICDVPQLVGSDVIVTSSELTKLGLQLFPQFLMLGGNGTTGNLNPISWLVRGEKSG